MATVMANNILASGATLTPAQRVSRAVNLINRDPELRAFGSLVMFTNIQIDSSLPTAATDGRKTYISPEFAKDLTDPELVFVVMHEALHVGFNHLVAWQHLAKQDPRLTNMACDYVINLMLHDLSKKTKVLTMPVVKDGADKGKIIGLLDEKFRGMDTKQVFDLLKQEQQNQSNGGEGKGSAGAGAGGPDDSFDDHMWDAADSMSDVEKEELTREVDRIIQQGLQVAGMTGASQPRGLLDLVETHVDWRDVLRDFVKSAVTKGHDNITWRRYNRRLIGSKIFMPSTYSEAIGEILVAIDTSGSIDADTLNAFASNVVSICEDVNPSLLRVVYWDHTIEAEEEYQAGEYDAFLASTRPAGGGGTCPDCIGNYIRENELTPEAVLVFTDGCFYPGDVDFDGVPTLWCITDDDFDGFVPPFGSAVEVKI